MTNERAQRIVDVPADEVAADPIAPPPVDRADQESQHDDSPRIAAEAPAPPADAEVADVEVPEPPEAVIERADVEADVAEVEDDEAGEPEAEPFEDEDTSEELDDADEPAASADELPSLLEALLFVADEPIAPAALGRALDRTPRQVRHGLDDLADRLREDGRGVRLQQGPNGAQLVTAPEAANAVETFLGLEANRRLSNAALETLAIIAYRQPVTRHVIEQIRGVSSDGAVATLRARGLIEGIGRAPGPGRPLLFSTTQRFLEHFGLERPDELPPLPDDVELPPEEGGAQLSLEAAIEGESEDTPADAAAISGDTSELTETADTDVDEVVEDALDTDDEFAPAAAGAEFEEFDGIEDDPDLEISDDLGDLSRAAGAAFGNPAEVAEASEPAAEPTPPWSPSASS